MAVEAVKVRGTSGVVIGGQRPGSRWVRGTGWRHVVAWLALAFAVFPVLWILSASVNPIGTLVSQRLVPSSISFDNYRELLAGDVPYLSWFRNTVVIAGVASLGNTMLSAFAAYAFSRMRFRGRRTGLLAVLLVQMFPQTLAFVAIFLIMANIGDVFPAIGLGSQLGLILVYLGGAMGVNTWLMKGFFDTIPVDLDESARIDGCTHNQVFFRIIFPLVAPILAVVFLLSFIFLINDFVLASAVLGQGSPDKFTLAVGLYRYLSDQFNLRWGPFAAGAIIAGVPVILLFQFLQRFIVSGLTQGAVKG
ncbi:MAG TPA: sugar ABC transporter permease [Acidimicrobiia bacterium]|nr:sugar ABC transporter permease [Acidimicrobiia bacterium]